MAPALISHGSWTPEEDRYSKDDYFRQGSPPDISKDELQVSSLDMKNYHSSNQDDLISDIVRSLRLSGGCIIRNMIPQESLSRCEHEIRPYLNKTKQADGIHSGILITLPTS